MPIRRLPPLLVNQIAAGEVIERPASVVKELVENSLDAAATSIDIAIDDGGRQLIRIADNGLGIVADELPLAVAPHATSKLQSTEQLEAIATMGFRGEALASVASVSRLRLTSRPTIDGDVAADAVMLEAAGDEVSEPRPTSSAPGTVVEVRDLFYNTPARRKFMRAATTEFSHIADVIRRIAMAHHDVAFKLSHNDKSTLDLPATAGEEARRMRCIDILGKDVDGAMLTFEALEPVRPGREHRAAVWGIAGLPAIARATAKFQYVYLNGRPIKDRNLTHAIREAYRGLMPPDRHPVVVVFIDIEPDAVDINVHPAKAEVRFREPGRLHGLVLSTLRQRLLGADLTPSVRFRPPSPATDAPAPNPGPADARRPHGTSNAAPPNASNFTDYFRSMAPDQSHLDFQSIRKSMEQQTTPGRAYLGPHDAPPQPPNSNAQPTSRRPILQIHRSYLVTQDDDGIVIVDQHALHERVMFEQLRDRVLGNDQPLEAQRLLMPAVIDASPTQIALLEPLRPLLQRIGIEAEPMGKDSIAIHAFPSFLFDRKVEPDAFLSDLLDKADEGLLDTDKQNVEEETLHEVLDMMACKAAVKAGDEMTDEELADLLARREQIERASSCPHGRPTTIRLSIRDLERQFGRS